MEISFKRFLSLALALLMVLSNVPVQAFAAETEPSVIEACTHTDVQEEVTKEATCKEAGEKKLTCLAEGCGYTWTETVEALEHNFVDGVCAVEGCGETDPNWVAPINEDVPESDGIIDTEDELQTAMQVPGNNITLGGTITLTRGLAVFADCTLDLAGHSITWNCEEYDNTAALMLNIAKMTIKDSVGGGEIRFTGRDDRQKTIQNNGELTIEGGKICFDGNVAPAIINGFIGEDGNDSEGTLRITGGEVEGEIVNTLGSITITGGTFQNNVSEYIAEGYLCELLGGKWAVVAEPEPGDFTAANEAELRAALKAGGTVKLTNRIDLQMAIGTGATLELDLAGHTLSFKAPEMEAPIGMIMSTGQLTITDSVGGGKVICTGAYSAHTTLENNNGMTITGGTFEIQGTGSLVVNKGTLTIKGGKFNEDVSDYVAEGYECKEVDSYWVVEPEEYVPVVIGPGLENNDTAKELQSNTAVESNKNIDFAGETAVKLSVTLTEVDEQTNKLTFEVAPVNENGEKVSELNNKITFRLPIPSTGFNAYAKVTHKTTSSVLEILEAGAAKYIEVSSNNFSEFVVEPYEEPVAKIGDEGYETLKEAVEEANAIAGGATVELLADVTLGEKLTISGNVTISGKHTITRDASYTGTLFDVVAGAALTLDGGLVVDGGNNWTFDDDSYKADRDSMTQVIKDDYVVDGVYQKYVTPEANAPVATAHMITVSAGTVNLKNVTFQNEFGRIAGVVQTKAAGSAVTLEGAKIQHIASMEGNGVAVHSNQANTITMNAGTVIDGNYVGGNHGMFMLYSGTKMTMNGGEIKNTKGWNSNGTAIGIYGTGSEFTMNGGEICSNSSVWGQANQRNMAVNVHSGSKMTMTGGTICHNIGKHYAGGIASYKTDNSVIITGGSVVNNISLDNDNRDGTYVERGDDIDTPGPVTITGGTYTQDVSNWLAPGYGLIHDAEKGAYTVTDHIYNLWFRDPVTHEQLPYVGPLQGNNPASLVETGKAFYANYYEMELEVLCDAKIDETIVIDYPMTVNLNGKTITGVKNANGEQVYPVIRVQDGAEVTVKNGNISNADYVFVLGASDGSSAGNLTIENGTYVGETTVASVTKGKLTINDGNFSISNPEVYGTDYLLNCIDANYKAGTAEIEVKGGTFYKFNPENNAAEGTGTSFLAVEHFSEEKTKDYFTVREADYVADVNGVKFESLADALAAANAAGNGAKLTLLKDIALGEKLTISGNVTISGEKTITRADNYTGTLFEVKAGATLTFQNVTVDGGNNWTFLKDEYEEMVKSGQRVNNGNVNYAVYEEGAPVATATVVSVSGNVILDGATFQNHVGSSVFTVGSGATLTMTNAKVDHNTRKGSSVVADIASGATWTINAGTEITNNHNHGGNGTLSYMKGTTIMNGGKICSNSGVDNNGSVFMLYGGAAKFVMNDGTICHNWALYGTNNGWNCAFYVYGNGSTFEMNGGVIEENVSTVLPGVASNGSNATIQVNGGKIQNNSSAKNYVGTELYGYCPITVGEGVTITGGVQALNNLTNNGTIDGRVNVSKTSTISGTGKVTGPMKIAGTATITSGTYLGEITVTGNLTITGGTFAQDVSAWLAPGYGLIHDAEKGAYTVTDHVYNLWFRDPVTHEQLPYVGPLQGNDPASLVKTGKAFYANYYEMELEVLCDAKIDETIVIDYPMTVNLNGKTITGVKNANGEQVYPVIRVQGGAEVTVKNGNISNADYVFVLGASDGSSAGNLTIENGTYVGETTVASVTKGKLTINDGNFSISNPEVYGTDYLLNCIDANYKAGTAEIEVKGGTFYKFNPENNAAEGANINFCAEGYIAEELTEGKWTVRQANYVVEVNGEKYESMADAVKAVPNGATATINVLKDYTETEFRTSGDFAFAIWLGNKKNITVDFDGHTVTFDSAAYGTNRIQSVFYVASAGASLTLTGNGTVKYQGPEGDGTTKKPFMYMVWAQDGDITLENGTYIAGTDGKTTYANLFYVSLDGHIYINGGSYTKDTREISGSVINLDNKATGMVTVTGGTFNENILTETQKGEVTIPEGYELIDNNDGTWSVVPNMIFEVHLTDKDGNAHWLSPMKSNNINSALKTAKVWYESLQGTYDFTLKILEDCTIKESVVVDFNLTVDLCGNTVTGGENVYPVFRIQNNANVTVKNGTVNNGDYIFVLGSADQGSAGYLTIENGTYVGETTVASVTKGKLTINDGNFSISNPEVYGTDYLLNCIDANYKNGNAVIEVKGGTFTGFNPADNAAEGAGTNFCAEGYDAVADGGNYIVKPVITVEFDNITMVYGNELPKFTYTTNFTEISEDGEMLVVGEPKVSVNGVGEYEIAAEAYVFMSDDYIVRVVPGTLIVADAVAEANGIKYESIEAAINSVETNNSEPVTIKVIKDHVIDTKGENYAVIRVDGKNVEIDLNGCKVTFDYASNEKASEIYASIYVGPVRIGSSFGGGTLVIYDSSEAKTGTFYNKGDNGAARIIWCATNGITTIENGNFVNEQKDTMFYTSVTKSYYVKNTELIVKGGIFKQIGNTDGAYQDCFNVQDNTASKQKIQLEGGTFHYESPKAGHQNSWEVKIADGFQVVDNGNNTWSVVPAATKVTVTVGNASMIEGNTLPTFSYTTDVDCPALNITYTVDGTTINATVAEMEGYDFEVVPGTLTVLEAVARVDKVYYADLQEAVSTGKTVNLLKDVVLAKTLEVELKNTYLKLDGHTISGDLDTLIHVKANGTVNFSAGGNAGYQNTGDVFFVESGNVNIYGDGTITSEKSNCVYVRGGKTAIQKANLIANGEYPAIQGNGMYTGDVTIQGGSISAPNTDIAIYWPQNGKLTVSGGTITGKTALYAKSGSIAISGGEFIATGEKADFAHNSNGATATGDAVVIESCMDAAYETPSVTITGGTFTSDNAEAMMFYDCSNTDNAAEIMELTGGIYSSMPDIKWCVEGKAPVLNDDKMWEIADFIVTVDSIAYSDWTKAMAAIKGDSNIVLYADIVNNGSFSKGAANKTLTLDLNGYNFTTTTIGVDGHKTLKIINSAETGFVKVTNYTALYVNGYLDLASNVDFTSKIQIGYHSVETPSTGCLLVDGVKLIGRGHFQKEDGIFGLNGGANVQIINGANNISLTSGNFTLNKDYAVTAGNFTVASGVTLNIPAEKTLTLNAATLFTNNGTVQGDGKVVVNTIDQFKTILAADIKNIELGSAMTLADELTISEDVFVTGMAKLTVTGKLTLTAGTYDMDVNKYCGDLYVAVDNGDDTWTVTGAVAAIGNVKYASLPEAVAAAQAGQTVKLLCNASGAGVVIDKKLTVDFGGFTYTVNEPCAGEIGFKVEGNGKVTLQNGTLAATAEIDTLVQNYANDLTVWNAILDGTNLNDSAVVLDAVSGNATFTGKVGMVGITAKEAGYAFVVGDHSDEGYTLPTVKAVGTVTITGKIDAAAQIGDVRYATLQQAYEAAADKASIKLLKDVETAGLEIDKNITINFNGKTYTATSPIQISEGKTVTFQGGTLKAASEMDVLVDNSAANLSVIHMNMDGTNLTQGVISNDNGKVKITGNTTVTAYNNAFAIGVYEAAVVTVDGSVKVNGKIDAAAKINTTYYGTLENAYTNAVAGNNITVLRGAVMTQDLTGKDVTVTINAGLTVDLDGKTLGAKNVSAFGNLIDSEDGVGAVKVTGKYYYTNHANMDYFPLFDAEIEAYRLYTTVVKTRGAKLVSADSLKYGYTVYFNDVKAYKLLGEMVQSNQFDMQAVWTGEEGGSFTYTFSDNMLAQFAEAAYNQMLKEGKVTKSMNLTVNGLSVLNSGDVIESTPSIASDIGVAVKGAVHKYTVS